MEAPTPEKSPEVTPLPAVRPARTFAFVGVGVGLAIAVGAGVVLVRKQHRARSVSAAIEAAELAVRRKPATKRADLIVAACQRATCACVVTAATQALDVDLAAEALRVIQVADCANEPPLPGLRAEALVGANRTEGASLATQVLAKAPNDAHARYALALAARRDGHLVEAIKAVTAAIEAGRGVPAHVLAGLIAYDLANWDFARVHFLQALDADPDNVTALYDLALVAQRANKYGEARQGYLKLLSVDPRNKNARYNLGVLAHSIGAADEATHDLEKLRALSPGDPLVERLEAVLRTPAVDAPPKAPPLSGSAAPGKAAGNAPKARP